MADTEFDVIIIGSGPGGYVTAIRSAQLGFKTAIVEREHLGGICLNWGCIPTKALLRSAEIYHYMKHADAYGLTAKEVGFDAAAVVKRSRAVSGRLNMGVGGLLKKNKVSVIWGEAKLTKPGEVVVAAPTKQPMQPQHTPPRGTLGPGTYRGKHIIVATGARPRVLPGSSPTASWCGPISRPWCRRKCRSRCWSWARAPSASNSLPSTIPWASM
jgi:dihydrolipoamide dehydrogenase